ncbi:MAG: fibronectin type III domain-containing protein, partial [Thermodesulfovibrionales bacterium]
SGLTEGKTYCFRIMAYNGSGDSAYSAPGTRMTLLSPPTLNNPSGFTTTSLDLSWNRVTGNAGYKIERKTGAGGTYVERVVLGQDQETYTDTGLTPGEQYYYRVYTKNSENYYSASPSTDKSARTTPAQPVVVLTVPSTSQVTLSWPVVYGATNYRIERKIGPAGTYEQIADKVVTYQELYCNQTYPYVGCTTLSPATTTHDDTGLNEGGNYCYQIKAYNSADNRDSAASAEQCTSTSDLAKPGLTGSALNSMNIQLTWSYNGSSPIEGAEIEARLTGVWLLLSTTNASTHTVVDKTGINPNTRYSYRVRVYNASGEKSEYSDEFSVVTPPYAQGTNTCN